MYQRPVPCAPQGPTRQRRRVLATTIPASVEDKAAVVLEAIGDASIPDVYVGIQNHPLTKAAAAQALTSSIGRIVLAGSSPSGSKGYSSTSTVAAAASRPPGRSGPSRSPRTRCSTTSRCGYSLTVTPSGRTSHWCCSTCPERHHDAYPSEPTPASRLRPGRPSRRAGPAPLA